MTSQFSGERLKVVRRLQQLTQTALAEHIAVWPSTVGRYERELTTPNTGTVKALCDVLDVHEHYLFGPPLVKFEEADVVYRNLAAMSKKLHYRMVAFGALTAEWIRYLRQEVKLLPVDVPSVSITNAEDVEKAAWKCREYWNLGGGPISNITRVLERAGVVVSAMDTEAREVDAFSVRLGDQALVILNTASGSPSRMIQSCAHELGHLVAHGDDLDKTPKEREREARQFAGAFLLPRQTFGREFWEQHRYRLDVQDLIDMKRRWGTSIQSILYRAHELRLIGPAAFRRWMKIASSRGWRSGTPEPAEPEPLRPETLMLAFQRYQELTGMGPSQVAERLGWGETVFKFVTGVSSVQPSREVVDITQIAKKRQTHRLSVTPARHGKPATRSLHLLMEESAPETKEQRPRLD